MRKSVGFGAALAAFALLAAACGGSSGSPSAAASASASGSPGTSAATTSIDVGYVPFDDDAVLFLAVEKGFFAQHGLSVTLSPAASPTPVVASMVSGQYQFGFVTTPVLINANIAGQRIQCVSVVDGQVSPSSDSAAFVSAKSSGITKLSQLSNKNVAVVQLSSINLFEARQLATKAGAHNVHFLAVPFPQMPEALAQGRVQAAVITSPFLQTALAQGANVLAHPNSQLFPDGTVYCYAGTSSYLAGHAKIAEEFRAAIDQSTLYAKTHLSEEKAALVPYLHLTPAVAQRQRIASNYVPVINEASILQTEQMMRQQGAITTTVNPATLVWNPPSGSGS